MRYGRSAIVATAAAIASAGALAFASAGPAAALDNVTGTGTTTCSAGYAGTFTFSPALKTGGTSTKEEVEVELSFTGCSGGTPVPVSGHYGAKGIVSGAGANNCANWFAPAVGTTPGIAVRNFNLAPLDGDVAWSPTNINQSNVRFSSMRIRTRPGATNYLTFKLPNAGARRGGRFLRADVPARPPGRGGAELRGTVRCLHHGRSGREDRPGVPGGVLDRNLVTPPDSAAGTRPRRAPAAC